MIGAVGNDEFAEPALSLLEADGVDLARVRRAAAPTGVALILVDREGENVIAVIPGANGTVSGADAAGLRAGKQDLLLLQLEVPLGAMAAAAEKARAGGATVVLNFAPFRAEAVPLLSHATHLVVNETECALIAATLGGEAGSIENQAIALAERTAATVIVTLGREGALAVESGKTLRVPALSVAAVDTVGAGDTFCGYLAAGLSEGEPLASVLRLAVAAGSLACTNAGAQPAIPLRADVAQALGADR